MKIIFDSINGLILIKDNSEIVNFDANNIIKYTAKYYNGLRLSNERDYIITEFIGVVQNYRYNQDEGYTGIYVRPLHVWNTIYHQWNKIINYKDPTEKYFLYPHLLQLPQCYYHSHPLHYLQTCQKASIYNYDYIVSTICLDDTIDKIRYDYPAIKRRTGKFREELIQKALHPSRIIKWIECNYFDD